MATRIKSQWIFNTSTSCVPQLGYDTDMPQNAQRFTRRGLNDSSAQARDYAALSSQTSRFPSGDKAYQSDPSETANTHSPNGTRWLFAEIN